MNAETMTSELQEPPKVIDLKIESGFWYLGTPYSKYAGGTEEAFFRACEIAARLIACKIPVFSPIAHSHPIAELGGLDALDHGIWLPADRPFMEAAFGLIVGMMPGWKESVGLAHEIEFFREAGKPVIYLDPFDA